MESPDGALAMMRSWLPARVEGVKLDTEESSRMILYAFM
jgi:hypothetical protein